MAGWIQVAVEPVIIIFCQYRGNIECQDDPGLLENRFSHTKAGMASAFAPFLHGAFTFANNFRDGAGAVDDG